MSYNQKMYIDGKWVDPATPHPFDVINPATEEVCATIQLGSAADVDLAVAAATRAFDSWSLTSREERLAALERIFAIYTRRIDEMAKAISIEMGAPMSLTAQAGIGAAHLEEMIRVLRDCVFDERDGDMLITREPVGVAGLITPWNWPMNQITCKVAPALAAGCTMVLKPSEIAPLSAILFSEIVHEAGLPPGVYNMVNGDGPGVGEAISRHPDIALVSFTGSTRAGIAVARAGAETVKRVHQELGGKSANIITPSADFEAAVKRGLSGCFGNTGQSCNAPTRMLVPRERMDEVIAIAKKEVPNFVVGAPEASATMLGPVVSKVQFDKIQALIQAGIDEGATLAAGGVGRPDGLDKGYYVKPTVFCNVTPDMTVSREEIFGPVLAVIPYDTLDEAVTIANDTPYGLAAYVQSGDTTEAHWLARRLRAGNVNINGAAWRAHAPFGGYKQSGNGREYGEYGLADFQEIKAVLGYTEA